VKGIKQGAADYIPKPFTLNEMILAVRKVLEHQAHEAERKDSETKIHKEAIIAILNKAAEDQEFLGKLTDSGSEALRGYELHPEEEAALISGDVGWIEAHIGELDDRLKTWLTCRLQQERW
jgi:DNA-binding response OmpR family regulator